MSMREIAEICTVVVVIWVSVFITIRLPNALGANWEQNGVIERASLPAGARQPGAL